MGTIFSEVNRKQVAFSLVVLLAAIVVGVMGWEFYQQFALARQMGQEKARLEALVEQERARNEELKSRLEYARSDEAVEEWARVEARMVKPGEVLVIPPADVVEPEPTEESAAVTEVEDDEPLWAELWALLFGE